MLGVIPTEPVRDGASFLAPMSNVLPGNLQLLTGLSSPFGYISGIFRSDNGPAGPSMCAFVLHTTCWCQQCSRCCSS